VKGQLGPADWFDAAAESVTHLKQRPGRQGSLLWDKVARSVESVLSSWFSVEELGRLLRAENGELRTSRCAPRKLTATTCYAGVCLAPTLSSSRG